MLKGVNWVAVLVATVVLEIVGYLWYGLLFGAQWAAGVSHAHGSQPHDPARHDLMMGLGAVNTLIAVVGLAWLQARLGGRSLGAIVGAAFAAWLFFDFTTMAVDYLYIKLDGQLVLINMGFQLVSYLLAGVIVGLWRPAPKTEAAAAA